MYAKAPPVHTGPLVCLYLPTRASAPPPPAQVRSLTLDTRAWEPSVVALFQSLGNAFANQVGWVRSGWDGSHCW